MLSNLGDSEDSEDELVEKSNVSVEITEKIAEKTVDVGAANCVEKLDEIKFDEILEEPPIPTQKPQQSNHIPQEGIMFLRGWGVMRFTLLIAREGEGCWDGRE